MNHASLAGNTYVYSVTYVLQALEDFPHLERVIDLTGLLFSSEVCSQKKWRNPPIGNLAIEIAKLNAV
jgi:hypothetical protein